MMTMTANWRTNVEQIISTGDMPAIDGCYERGRAIGLLEDYASHPNSSELVVERANNAIEKLQDDRSEDVE